jgi:flagella synthesis protein FlgN
MTFKSELFEVSKLVKILETEQSFLVDKNLSQHQGLDDERLKVLDKITAYSERRYRWLAKAGYPPNESGMCDWCLDHEEPSAQDAWLKMQELLVKAKVLNRANVLLVSRFSENKQKVTKRMRIVN